MGHSTVVAFYNGVRTKQKDFIDEDVNDDGTYKEYGDAPKTKCDLCNFEPIPVERAEDYVIDDEKLCTFFDDDECQATFVYGYQNQTGELKVSF